MSPRNKLILTIALAVVGIIALAALLIYPQIGKLRDLDAQIVQAQADIDRAKALLEQRQAIKSQASQTNAALLRLSNELPENPELPSLIIELQDTANEAGVDFKALTPTAPEARSGYSAVKLTVDVTGEWADTIDFMQRLNKLTRQVRVLGYTATPASAPEELEEDAPLLIRTTFDLEVYTLAAADAAAGIPPAPPAQ